ncbi:ABC transporter permease, partial [Acinetobacter baumannii]|nr:ABC transporter permease [Acinetobacter baumannii]
MQALSALVGVVALCALAGTVLAGLNERRRELAVLRAIGARPGRIFLLLVCEGGVLTAAGPILGLAAVQLAALALGPWLLAHWGLALEPGWPGVRDLALLAAIVGAGLAASALPAWRAYR